MSSTFTRERRRLVWFALTLSAWAAIYTWRALDQHFSLRSNAYDLSVFDYALWTTGRGPFAYVPFMGHSLFSHHFMPTLFALWPAYQLFPSPVFLIVVQVAAFGAAAILLSRLLPDEIPTLPAMAILAAFLFGRRSHSAVASVFYPEGLEPLFVFAALLAWRSGRRAAAVAAGLLAAGCKEDMAIYIAAFAVLVLYRQSQRAGLIVATAAAIWLIAALTVAIPLAQSRDGLALSNPFVDAAMGSSEAVQRSVDRLSIGRTMEVLTTTTASAGFLCWGQPAWLAVALPGLVLTIAADARNPGGGVSGHYLFPILPWIFAAAALGAGRLQRSRPRLLTAIGVLLLVGTAVDSPLWRTLGRRSEAESAEAATVRRELAHIPDGALVLAMPNLVPHISHRVHVRTIGAAARDETPAYVAISRIGDLWPLGPDGVQATIDAYAADARYVQIRRGPLHLFRRADE